MSAALAAGRHLSLKGTFSPAKQAVTKVVCPTKRVVQRSCFQAGATRACLAGKSEEEMNSTPFNMSALRLLSGLGLQETASSLKKFRMSTLSEPSNFVKPRRLSFNQAEMVEDAGVDVVDHPRAMTSAFVYELCAGIIDKDKSLEAISKEEIFEECGYNVPLDSIKRITSFLTSVGISGARQTIFYAEVDESMRVSSGGGNASEGEAIDVVALPTSEIDSFVTDEAVAKSAGLMFSLMWLKANILSTKVKVTA
eukprot:jgi/Mesvir1/15206/Mv06439-RA.3